MNIPGITGTFKTDEAMLSKIAGLEDKELPSPKYAYITSAPAYVTPTIILNCHASQRRFKFNPQEDISTFELAWITQMLVVISASHGAINVDVDSYITEHKIERHFEII
jgi:hypothetical protein